VCDASTWRGTQRRHGITVAPGKCQDQSGSTARWGTNGARDDEFIGPPACLPVCSKTTQSPLSAAAVSRCSIHELPSAVHTIYTASQKKQDTILLPVTSPNVNRFSNFFTLRLSGKFAIKSFLNIPPHLKHGATLSCEISMLKKATLKQ